MHKINLNLCRFRMHPTVDVDQQQTTCRVAILPQILCIIVVFEQGKRSLFPCLQIAFLQNFNLAVQPDPVYSMQYYVQSLRFSIAMRLEAHCGIGCWTYKRRKLSKEVSCQNKSSLMKLEPLPVSACLHSSMLLSPRRHTTTEHAALNRTFSRLL
jgi:hypothetical protein